MRKEGGGGGGRWLEGGLTYNVSYKADDTSGIAFQAVSDFKSFFYLQTNKSKKIKGLS